MREPAKSIVIGLAIGFAVLGAFAVGVILLTSWLTSSP